MELIQTWSFAFRSHHKYRSIKVKLNTFETPSTVCHNEIICLNHILVDKNVFFCFNIQINYRMQDTMNILKADGHSFPELKEADAPAMFTADTAPDWADGEVCHRCRTGFSITNRKHQ